VNSVGKLKQPKTLLMTLTDGIFGGLGLAPMFGLHYREEGAEASLAGAPLRRDRAKPLLFYPQHRRDRFIDYGAELFRRGFNSAFNQIGVQVTDCLNNLAEL